MPTPLRIATPATPASLSQQIRQLQAEARRLAREHVASLSAGLARVHDLAEEVADGGEAYPAGIRDMARRMAEDAAARVQALEVLLARA